MKLIISLSATPILYHATGVRSIIEILQSDSFKLSPAEHISDTRANSGFKKYLSLSRSKHGEYSEAERVHIVLDGTKLANNHKIIPVDYFYSKGGKNARVGTYEMEDRLVSNKSKIPAVKYIKEIHTAHLPSNILGRDRLRTFLSTAHIRSIPVFVYSEIKLARNMDKRKAFSKEELDEILTEWR